MKFLRVACASVFLLGLPGLSLADDALGLSQLDSKIEDLRRREYSIKRLLADGQSEKEVLRRRIIARGRAYYRLARSVPGGDFFEHAVRVERLRRGILSDISRLRNLAERSREAAGSLTAINDRRTPLEEERRVTGRARDALLSQKERDAAFERAFSAQSDNHTAIYSAELHQTETGESFADLQGRLPFPLAGRAEVRELKRADGSSLLAFSSRSARDVRSVAAGRVVDISQRAGRGSAILIDHGEGYLSYTTGLSELSVTVGDELPAHARLGQAQVQGESAELTIELRSRKTSLSPAEWFGL